MRSLDEICSEYEDSKYREAELKLNTASSDFAYVPKPKGLEDYKRYLNALTNLLEAVGNVTLEYCLSDIKELVKKEYGSYITKHQAKKIAIDTKYSGLVDSKVEKLENAAKEYNQRMKDKFNEDNHIYVELEEKRTVLESYSSDIIDLCSAYGITTSDVEIDNSSFTVSELGSIYDEYITYMEKAASKRNPIGAFRERFDNTMFQATVLGLILLLSFTVILDLVAIVFFGAIVYSQIKAKDKMKTYSVLLGLVFNVHPLEMGFKDEMDTSSLKDETVNEDEDERLAGLAVEWEEALKKLDTENPETKMNDMLLELVNCSGGIKEEFRVLLDDFNASKNNLINKIQKELEKYRKEFEDEKSKVKLLGDSITESAVFDTRFKLGIKDGIIEESKDVGLSNIVIRPHRDKEKLKMFLQVLLANAICNVKANTLTITVYDPNDFGQDLVSFYHSDLEKIFIFKNEKLDETITELKNYAMANMKDMKGMDINTFNIEAEKSGRTPKEYKLLIVLSQPKQIDEDEALSAFMKYSAKMGVFVWLVSAKEIADTKVFNTPFEGVANPYQVDMSTFGPKVAATLINTIKNAKTDALFWEDFIEIAVPDKDTWTYLTDNMIELDPGFYEGDPTQFKGYTVGNQGNVHIIGVGGTGAGKSVFLNHIIATACKKYAPSTLELWLCDYKGTEFKFYLPSKEYPYMLPHIKACLCTSDGDYAGSLYTALRTEAERRYNFLKEVGYKNIKDYNKFLRTNGRESEVIRRILFVNDEFQVIFEKAESRVIEQINKDITYISKVARAAGIHLFFTSQSMKKTLSADILQQFTLRFALRCDEEVSVSVLGTKFASEIKQPNGYLYVRSVEDASLQAQKRYRTPYARDNVLHEFIKELAIRAEKENMPKHDVITYEESTLHRIEELDEFYRQIYSKEQAVPDSGVVVLGNRMTYDPKNRAPDNVILLPENNSHIFSVFSDTTDLINFYRTLMCNIRNWKTEVKTLQNSQIADLHYLCELDRDVPADFQELSNEKASIYDLLNLYEGIYENRVQNNKKDDPVFIILIGWDKAVGFGIEKDAMLMQRFAKLLQICGEYSLHFVFISTDIGAIGTQIVEACKTRIAGKVEEKASYAVLGTKQASKSSSMKNGYMYIWRGGAVTRAKTYLTEQTREVKKNELVL